MRLSAGALRHDAPRDQQRTGLHGVVGGDVEDTAQQESQTRADGVQQRTQQVPGGCACNVLCENVRTLAQQAVASRGTSRTLQTQLRRPGEHHTL